MVSNTTLTITGVAEGEAAVGVTARDPSGLWVSFEIAVAVVPANRRPAINDSIAPVEMFRDSTRSVDLRPHYTDPDGDSLAYSAVSSDSAVAGASVAGTELTIVGVAEGVTSVEVTATDPEGAAVSMPVAVTVRASNAAPIIVDSIAPITVVRGAVRFLDLARHFTDPDGDSLRYSTKSSDVSVAVATVSGERLTVVGVDEGTASVEVTATDPYGASVSLPVAVEVRPPDRNDAPVISDSIALIEVRPGATLSLDLSGHFTDPDGDSLAYSVGSSNSSIAPAVASGAELSITGVAEGGTQAVVRAFDGVLSTELVVDISVTDDAPFSLYEAFDDPNTFHEDWVLVQTEGYVQAGVLHLSTSLPGLAGIMLNSWSPLTDRTALIPLEVRVRLSFDTERVGVELWLPSRTEIPALVLGSARVADPANNFQVSLWTDLGQPQGEFVEGSAGYSVALPRASKAFVEIKLTRTPRRLLATIDNEQILDLSVPDWSSERITSFGIVVSGILGEIFDVGQTVSIDFISNREMDNQR